MFFFFLRGWRLATCHVGCELHGTGGFRNSAASAPRFWAIWQRAPVVRRNAAQLMLAHHLPSTVPTALPATQEQRRLPLPPFHGRRLRAASQRYPKIEGRVSCSFHTVQTSDFGSTANRVDDMPEERSKAPPSVAVPVRALTMPCVPTHAGQVYSSKSQVTA